MKSLIAATFLAGLMFGATGVSAMPLAPATTGADIIRVAGGCGPGFHPNPYGVCRPNRGPVIVAPGVVVAPVRVCPPGFVIGRYGRCRPI